jgi:hypothetical protein
MDFRRHWLTNYCNLPGGQTTIYVNREIGPFFYNARGMRKGDPLSPILFDFMVDALAAMILRVRQADHIQGWFPT